MLRRRPELVTRVHSLLRRGQVLGPVGSRTLALAVTCSMAFGVFELSRCPQLVAFETTLPTAASVVAKNNASFAASPSDFPSTSPFKVVYAKAIQPASQTKPANAARRMDAVRSANANAAASNSGFDRSVLKASAAQQNDAVPVVAQMNPAQSNAQGYIVLTTWEQESTTLPNSGSNTVAGSDQSENSSVRVASRTIVTQTIFRVLPAKAIGNRHAGTNSTFPSPELIPTLIPSRDGWLVLEL